MSSNQLQPVSLDAVLAYRHAGVVRRYAKEQEVSAEEAAEVFQDTLKWLYLCYRAAIDGPERIDITMLPDLAKLDEMWHTFVLFTLDYADFCENYFGFFLHHVPTEDEDEAPPDDATVRATLERQYALVYDVLGEDTLLKWHDECRYAAVT